MVADIPITQTLTSPRYSRANRLVDLVAIFEPEVQVCHWPRPSDPRITHYLMALESKSIGGFRQVVTAGKPIFLPGLPNLPARDVLATDLNFLIAVYSDLLGCPRVGLRFERLDRAMCPGFHVDRLGIRLICTYCGPGTEWLKDQSIDRHRLADIDTAAADICEAPVFALVLLKGTLWQGNQQGGAIHRSPTVPPGNERRVLVTLDALWTS